MTSNHVVGWWLYLTIAAIGTGAAIHQLIGHL